MPNPFGFVNRLLTKGAGIYGPFWQKVQPDVWGRRPHTGAVPQVLFVELEEGGKSFLVTLSEDYTGDISETWELHVAGYGDYTATGEAIVGEGVAPTITTATLGAMTYGSAFSQVLAADGDTPITWTVSAGSLPSGLTLDTDGTLHGTPDASGAYDFTVQAENDTGTDTQQYTGYVFPANGILLETGDYLLAEDGAYLILE